MLTNNADSSSEAPTPDVSAPRNGRLPGILGDESSVLSVRADDQADSSHPDANHEQQISAASTDADEASMREFYSQLVTLLTQENSEQPKKKNRNNLIATLRRRWLPALLVGGIAFAVFSNLLRPRQSNYTSSVVLLLPPRATVGNSPDPFAPPEEAYDTEAELAILGSEEIVKKAMSKMPDALKISGWGSKEIEAAPVYAATYGSPSLINISVSSSDLRASLRFSNEMVAAYKDYTRNRYERSRRENLQITEQRAKESGSSLEKARNELRVYKVRTGISDALSQQGNSAININALEDAVSKARAEAAAGNRAESIARDPRLESLRQQALEANYKYQNFLRDFSPDSPYPPLRAAEREFRRLSALAQARTNELRADNNRRLSQLEASLRVARSRAATLPGVEQKLNRLNERVQLLQNAYRAASDRANQLNLSRGTVAPTAKVLHAPSVSSSLGSQSTKALAISLVAALGLGILGAWLANRLDRSVRTISDPDELFEVPILGVMPATGGSSPLQLSGMNTKRGRSALQTATIEACYTTQSNLLAAAKILDSCSILITSSVPGEGKSQCASNLATAMAYGGQTVLLIDADFFHPSQHEIMKMSLEPGYEQVLQGKITLKQAVRATPIPNLHLLSAGKKVLEKPEDIIALLGGPAHQQNLKTLAKFYDVILIDGPPTMSMADAQLLSNMADSIVLVAAERTHQEDVYRARSMLRLAGGLLLGVIVNRVNLREINGWNLNSPGEAPFTNYANSLRQRAH